MSPLKQSQLLREKRIQQFLDAALTVYVRSGYSGADMDVVAQEAGLAKGLLYYYFNTKQELFRALFDRALEQAADCSEQAFQAVSGQEPVERLVGYLFEMYKLARRDSRLMRFALRMPFDCAAVFGAQQWKEGARRSLAHRNALESILRDAMEEGIIPQADATLLAGSLWTVFMGNLFDFGRLLMNDGTPPQPLGLDHFREIVGFSLRGVGLADDQWEPYLERLGKEEENNEGI